MDPFPLPENTALTILWPVCLICLTISSMIGVQLCNSVDEEEQKTIQESRYYAIRDILTESQKELKRIRKALEHQDLVVEEH
jgi:hypothetical protein